MQPQPRLISLQAVTFLHPGTGSTTGIVDLPILREVHTQYPMIAGSGIKGSLRDKAEQTWNKSHPDIEILFGSAVDGEQELKAGGAINVTDARILAFPVRSLQQVFIWVTCPMVIQRLLRDINLVGLNLTTFNFTGQPEAETAWVTDDNTLISPLILEELDFQAKPHPPAQQLAELIQSLLIEDSGFDAKRLAIIPDQDFQHLVRYATQVSARIRLNDRKTTDGDGGNLWYEETLPPETIMYSLVLCHVSRQKNEKIAATAVAKKLDSLLANGFLQIGGNETIGQGWCCVKINHQIAAGGES